MIDVTPILDSNSQQPASAMAADEVQPFAEQSGIVEQWAQAWSERIFSCGNPEPTHDCPPPSGIDIN